MVKSLDFNQQRSNNQLYKKQPYGSRQYKHLLKVLFQKMHFQKMYLKTEIFKIVPQKKKKLLFKKNTFSKLFSQNRTFETEILKISL